MINSLRKDSIINAILFTLLKRLFLSVIFIFLFTNCSTNKMIQGQSDYENNLNEINYLGSFNSSKVYLLDNTIFNTSYINISRDSLTFINEEDDSSHQITINQLSKIVIKDNTASFFGGLWTGIGSWALAILISSAATDCKTCHPNIGPLIIGAIVAPIGFIAGYNATGEKEFLFDNTQQ